MDHIPLPQAPNSDHLEVPLYEYDPYPYIYSGPWVSYPERCGWDYSEFYGMHAETFPNSVRGLLAAFVQSWLFFGVLDEFLGVPCPVPDWTAVSKDGRPIITTAHLFAKLEEWHHGIASRDEAEQIEVRNRIDHLLDRMRYFHHMLMTSLTDFNTYSNLLPEPLNLSLDVLHATLVIARNAVFAQATLSFPHYHHADVIKHTLLQNGWCPSDIFRVYQDATVLGRYYVSRLGPLNNITSHPQCTEDACRSCQIDRQAYQTKHVSAGCDCDMICVSTDAVAEILREGSIPTIRLNNGMNAIELEQVGSCSPTNFTAISHVWSDGLGNLHSNGLPTCQLKRIQKQVNDLQPFRQPDSSALTNRNFWIDTICVPTGSDFEAERSLAIAKMVKVYRLAKDVLILSSELHEIDSCRGPWELSARINRTAWFRRLWTLHEGILSKRSIFQLRDGAVELSSLAVEVETDPDSDSNIYQAFLRAIFRETCMPFTKMEAFKSMTSHDRIQAIWSAVQWRTTSYLDDETICLANMLDLDLSTILAISRHDPEACEKRMKAFILLQRYFPRDSVFESSHRLDLSSVPNLTAQGFRWAPKSFVFRSTSIDPATTPTPLVEADSAGLHLSLPSFNPACSWAEVMEHIAISKSEGIADAASIKFMLPLDWDYYYDISWLPEDTKWEINDTLLGSTIPAVALRDDIISVTKEGQDRVPRRPSQRMFELDSQREGISNSYDLDRFDGASSEALLLAVSARHAMTQERINGAEPEYRASIVARVHVRKRMFSTYRRPASDQVKILSTDADTGRPIPIFGVWPAQTRWCIG
ncbi:hypothetical protein A1O7_07278 [Cladophialophora yegresii CBS 114405]|uniref:Heterokaryon incompatibility domain-containing protein n=1 Tax=Cladophialophora yegresii CBS 114405 TaxID=1182544 RepID=W9WEI3_9EURO|nr:uncharacterized protein A1O7_07278 [Cladophialophora yegresii CBS 114405]EXJ56934.1 hypothetical protein A1O7_07278 [Cladophialophora yegresii CBS 114405]